MSYNTQIPESKQVWEEAITLFTQANFLQSWNWGVFQEALGKTVVRFFIVEEDTVVGLAQCVLEEAKRGTYLTIAGGPLFDWSNKKLMKYCFSELRAVARAEGADFIRFRPQELESQQVRKQVHRFGAVEAQMHLTADLTLQLDLSQSEDELLSQMRKNHRSAIRKAEKLGISVTKTADPDEIQEFYNHQLELAQKHGFVPFSYEFLHEQFQAFTGDDQVLLFHAKQGDDLLASAFIIFYNGEAVYHYGISTDANAKLPGSYACQWAAIKEAKQRGCSRYNFWGIAPADAQNHRFAGVTLFKRGFGGEEVEYLHAHDIPMSFKYYLTAAFEFVRKKMRRL